MQPQSILYGQDLNWTTVFILCELFEPKKFLFQLSELKIPKTMVRQGLNMFGENVCFCGNPKCHFGINCIAVAHTHTHTHKTNNEFTRATM